MPSVQTSVSAVTAAPGDEVAELGFRIGTVLLALGCIKPGAIRHFIPLEELWRDEPALAIVGRGTAF